MCLVIELYSIYVLLSLAQTWSLQCIYYPIQYTQEEDDPSCKCREVSRELESYVSKYDACLDL
jgi:hypothetical protein